MINRQNFYRYIPWTTSEQISFFYRLATYLRAGVPLLESVNLLAQGRTNTTTRTARAISTSLSEGLLFSESIIQHATSIHPLVQPILIIGERSGTLPECLSDLVQVLNNQKTLQQNLVGACVYPAIIVCGTLGIGFFLVTYVFPTILPLLQGLGSDLPLATRMLIGLSSFITKHWITLVIACILGFFAYGYARTHNKMRTVHDRLFLRIPLIGALLREYSLVHTTHTIYLLLKHGVPLPEGLTLCIATTQNYAFREALDSTAHASTEGELLSVALAKHPNVFPHTYIQIIAVGERTGSLPSVLETLYDHHKKEFTQKTKNLITLIEPVLMITMGLIVGYIALAIIMPVYQLSSSMYQ